MATWKKLGGMKPESRLWQGPNIWNLAIIDNVNIDFAEHTYYYYYAYKYIYDIVCVTDDVSV